MADKLQLVIQQPVFNYPTRYCGELIMDTTGGKTLVMVGIHRKGEKGFKTRVRKDYELPRPEVATFNKKVDFRTRQLQLDPNGRIQ